MPISCHLTIKINEYCKFLRFEYNHTSKLNTVLIMNQVMKYYCICTANFSLSLLHPAIWWDEWHLLVCMCSNNRHVLRLPVGRLCFRFRVSGSTAQREQSVWVWLSEQVFFSAPFQELARLSGETGRPDSWGWGGRWRGKELSLHRVRGDRS